MSDDKTNQIIRALKEHSALVQQAINDYLVRDTDDDALTETTEARVSRLETNLTVIDKLLHDPRVASGNNCIPVQLLYTTAPEGTTGSDGTSDLDGGKYRGVVLAGDPEDSSPTGGKLALPEGMKVGDEVIIYHTAEDGLETHWLVSATEKPYAVGRFGGSAIFRQGARLATRPIVIIDTAKARKDSPSELGDGTEGSETADTHYWSRDELPDGGDRYGDCPIKDWYVSRNVYNESGDKVLYQMMRYKSYDADGKLNYISAETRVEVDAAEDCTAV